MGGQLWEVVGGGKAGGIVVRQGEDLQSPQLGSRLATGAVVSEEKLVGERLCYKKVSGDGPEKGWVSLKLKGTSLLVTKEAPPAPAPVKKAPPKPPPELTRDQALELQRDLRNGFMEADFQQQLRALLTTYPEGGKDFNKGRTSLLDTVYHVVLPKYGYEANFRGRFLMGQAMTEWSNKDETIGDIGMQITMWLLAPCSPAGCLVFPPPGLSWDGDWLPPLPEGHAVGWLNAFGMESVANLRDVAGVEPTRPRRVAGGRLKRGMLFRTASWSVATEADVGRLTDVLGIKTYFDLRQGKDVEGIDGPIWDTFPPSPSGRHADQELRPAGEFRRLHFDFARNTGFRMWSDDERAASFGDASKMPSDDLRRQTNLWYQLHLRKIGEAYSMDQLETHLAFLNCCILFSNDDIVLAAMRACTEEENFPVAFGCMTGKDRTGLMSMLVLSALGASKDEIMEDYLLTNLAAAHNSEVIGDNYAAYTEQKRQKEEEMYKAWLQEEERKAAEAAAAAVAAGEAPAGEAVEQEGAAREAPEAPVGEVVEQEGAAGEAPEAGEDAAREAAPAAGEEGSTAEVPAAEPGAELQEPVAEEAATAAAEAQAAPPETSEGQPEGDQQPEAQQDAGSIASNQDNLKAAKVFRGVMEYTLHVLECQAGGAIKYLNSIGFGPEDIAKLREILVEPEEPEEA